MAPPCSVAASRAQARLLRGEPTRRRASGVLAPPARPTWISDRHVRAARTAGRATKARKHRHDPRLPSNDPGECSGGHLALVQTLLATDEDEPLPVIGESRFGHELDGHGQERRNAWMLSSMQYHGRSGTVWASADESVSCRDDRASGTHSLHLATLQYECHRCCCGGEARVKHESE